LELQNDKRKEGTTVMKNTTNQYVALDVHQATLVVSVRDEAGSVRMRATVPTEQKAIVDLVGGLSGRIHVGLRRGNAIAVAARCNQAARRTPKAAPPQSGDCISRSHQGFGPKMPPEI